MRSFLDVTRILKHSSAPNNAYNVASDFTGMKTIFNFDFSELKEFCFSSFYWLNTFNQYADVFVLGFQVFPETYRATQIEQ